MTMDDFGVAIVWTAAVSRIYKKNALHTYFNLVCSSRLYLGRKYPDHIPEICTTVLNSNGLPSGVRNGHVYETCVRQPE